MLSLWDYENFKIIKKKFINKLREINECNMKIIV